MAYECIIVFDGDHRYSGGREQRLAGVRCIFSRSSHGGDDEIIRIVRDHKGDRTGITVVSDDNKVGNSCRAHGAAVRPSDFIMVRKARPTGPKTSASRDGKNLDGKAAAAIDSELRKKWG